MSQNLFCNLGKKIGLAKVSRTWGNAAAAKVAMRFCVTDMALCVSRSCGPTFLLYCTNSQYFSFPYSHHLQLPNRKCKTTQPQPQPTQSVSLLVSVRVFVDSLKESKKKEDYATKRRKPSLNHLWPHLKVPLLIQL